MRLLGNIIWLIFGGLFIACNWFILGIIMSITIIGIPLGIQCFKMAGLTLVPFGQTVVYSDSITSGFFNILWALTFGWLFALGYLISGIANCITIIGIPFGIQSFKMMKLAFAPFGAQVVPIEYAYRRY
ncbi:YccF domain-containing protein [Alloscardovia omnicolens]|uniref:YccF domain-containing protein n=1 Tax=Alloscardovia omnicolens TaxID=419015 RepID=UPI003A671B7E